MKTGEEYEYGAYGWYIRSTGYPYRIGIEWVPDTVSVYNIFSQLDPIITVSDRLLAPIAGTLITVANLFDRSNIVTVPDNLFRGCDNLVDFSNCFYGCNDMRGRTPKVDGLELWERFPDANGQFCFYECTGLDNYDEIPEEWK